jgi:hypothetical protein
MPKGIKKKRVGFAEVEASVTSIERDENGLISQPKVEYVYDDRGFVDWRKMVKPEYLVSNRQRTQESDITKLEDKDLLILLGGIKELAQIRGYDAVEYDVKTPSADYVVATCRIKWIPNFETEGRGILFSAIADASPGNTHSFASDYLAAIAENRSFVRCVRNFLRINIVGQDELGAGGGSKQAQSNDTQAASFNPKEHLSALMKQRGITFEKLKAKLVQEEYEKSDAFNSVKDIPNIKIFELIDRIQNSKRT